MQRWFFLESERQAFLRKQATSAGEKAEDEPTELKINIQYKGWRFRVKVPDLKPEEVVCVIGESAELGNWIPEKCRALQQEPGTDIWSETIRIPTNQRIHYRYCVCVMVEVGSHVIVRHWETNIKPRKIKPGANPTSEPEIYGTYRGCSKIDHGWLTKGTIVQLEFSKTPFKIWRPRFQTRDIHVKITPVNLVRHSMHPMKSTFDGLDESVSVDHLEDRPKFSYTEVSSLLYGEPCFTSQGQFGHKFVNGDMLTFKTFLLNPSHTAFLIDLYVYSSKAVDDEPPYHAGFTYLLPGAMDDATKGELVLPLTSMKQRPLGELRLRYLMIRPLTSFQCTMETTFQRYWNKGKKGLDIGHRGSGNSFKMESKDCSEIRENTIASLKTAINYGADFVEFDVQLSKDSVPVIYHDFHVCIAMRRKKTLTDGDMFELPIKDLTFDQLRMLKVYHVIEGKTKNPRFFDEDLEEHQPFPTLQHALEALSPKCGFNIELKCSNKLMDGTQELHDFQDLNMFVDTILNTVLTYGGERRIVFSSFSPDACTLVRAKQNKYPIMFLTQGETKRYPAYDDPRCWTLQSGVHFAKIIEILGISCHTEDILRDPALVKYGLDNEIVMFCWGDDIADPGTITYLKNLGLHGIIYDKIYQYLDKEGKESIYLLEARESQKELIKIAASEATSPHAQPSHFPFKKAKCDFERDNVSTATSLESLETGKSETDHTYS